MHGDKETRRALAVNSFVRGRLISSRKNSAGAFLDGFFPARYRRVLQRSEPAGAGVHHSSSLVRGRPHRQTGTPECLWPDVASGGTSRSISAARAIRRCRTCGRAAGRRTRQRQPTARLLQRVWHHATAVVTEKQGQASILRCPYHGWSYGLDGSLKGAPEFEGVCGFDRSQNGLVPVRVETWEQFVFVNLDPNAAPLAEFLGRLVQRVVPLNLGSVHFFERRSYSLNCNW